MKEIFLLLGLTYEVMDRNELSGYLFPDCCEAFNDFDEALKTLKEMVKRSMQDCFDEVPDDKILFSDFCSEEDGISWEYFEKKDQFARWEMMGESDDIFDAGSIYPSYKIEKCSIKE